MKTGSHQKNNKNSPRSFEGTKTTTNNNKPKRKETQNQDIKPYNDKKQREVIAYINPDL